MYSFTECPSSVNIVATSDGSLEAGGVLTCKSDGHPESSYLWTNNDDGVTVSTGPSVTLTDDYYSLKCTATGNITTPCTASKTIAMIDGTTDRNHSVTEDNGKSNVSPSVI